MKSMKFDLQSFEELTPQCRDRVIYEAEVESTNDLARKDILAGRGASGQLYLAEHQTKGRGRGGNRWVCPAGEGLLFSLVVEPDVLPAFWYRMSLAVGLAIVDVLSKLGIEAKLKWPNDLYIEDKKLGGILIENVNGFLIVGVGMNIYVQNFPEEVAARATSLFLASGQVVDREALLSEIVKSIFKIGSLIGADFGCVRERVMESFYLKNQRVSMLVHGEAMEVDVVGLSENGYLLVQYGSEMAEINQASEIKIIRLR